MKKSVERLLGREGCDLEVDVEVRMEAVFYNVWRWVLGYYGISLVLFVGSFDCVWDFMVIRNWGVVMGFLS